VALSEKQIREPGPRARLAIDFGPLIIWLIVYFSTRDVLLSTGVFMAATMVAIGASWLAYRHISALLIFSGVMVLGLGGLTLWLKDPRYIQMKPTAYYLLVAAILGFGIVTGRPTIKLVLGHAFPGLNDIGWAKLTRNWALFFVAMAVANELVWRNTSMGFWLGYKFWGAMPATFLFMIANIPMLMRHGLNAEQAEDAALPPQG
jgi:intracellular septation protein